MDLIEYKAFWEQQKESLFVYSPAQANRLETGRAEFDFLTKWGLPGDVAPGLSFDDMAADELKTPNEIFGLQKEDFGNTYDELENYLTFGYNDSGDTICFDLLRNNEIVFLNHENYFERIFINTNIIQLGYCIVVFRKFIDSLIIPESDHFDRRKFTETELERLRRELLTIDPACSEPGCFWDSALDVLQAEMDEQI